uniref:VM domain-containing protein n=1 Tax=Megaselia scalaris TaxID=36166 RepID=T1GY65_MEGSC
PQLYSAPFQYTAPSPIYSAPYSPPKSSYTSYPLPEYSELSSPRARSFSEPTYPSQHNTYPSPVCPLSYLISCQLFIEPIGCSSHYGNPQSSGSIGAYSKRT